MPEVYPTRPEAGIAAFQPVDEEAELVRRAKARQPEAWAQIYDRFHGVIYRYVLMRLRNEADAEDLAAQCFLRAFSGIDGYSYRGKPIVAWLYRIAGNLVADRIKQRRRQSAVSLDETAVNAVQLGPDATVDSIDLQRALDGLKREQREVVVLRFFLSLSIREVAQMLGKSEGAVHSLQVRAIEALRSKLSR